MKKKFALLILVILTVSLALAACGSPAKTEILTRWEKNGETHVFDISLADFSGTDNTFNVYNSIGEPDIYSGNYYKDIAFKNEFANWDEIRPVAVKGTYTLTIQPSPDRTSYCDVEGTQKMCVAYNAADIDSNSELLSAVATTEQLADCGMVDTFDSQVVILYSYTHTTVRFENDPEQKPLESSTTVNGFYVGKRAQTLTNYTIKTKYDYESSRPVAKITKGESESVEYTFSKNSAGSFIDSNQILLYLRSLDKSKDSFKDSPSISVFNPYEQSLKTASFGFSYAEYNVILTRNESKLATSLNVVSVLVGNNSFMMQENLPDTVQLGEKQLDLGDAKESKFTTVRFRVGYLAYEIAYDNDTNTVDWGEIWTALTTAPKTEEK